MTKEVLAGSPLFANIEYETIRPIIDAATYPIYEPEAEILAEGDTNAFLGIIVSGYVRVVRRPVIAAASNPPGKVYLAYSGPGELLGELNFLDASPHSATVEALSRCKVAVLPHEMFRNHADHVAPVLYRNLAVCLGNKLRFSGYQIEILQHKRARRRLAKAILMFALIHGYQNEQQFSVPQSVTIDLFVGRDHLADIACVGPELLSRFLAEMREQSIISSHYKKNCLKITSLNFSRLATIAYETSVEEVVESSLTNVKQSV